MSVITGRGIMSLVQNLRHREGRDKVGDRVAYSLSGGGGGGG